MLKKSMPFLAFVLVGVLTCNAAAQPAQAPPTLVLRLASLDNFVENIKLLGGLMGGKDDSLQKLEDSIKSKLGPRGLYGIDRREPIAFYARVGKDISDISGVLMVPITSDKDFKEMLGTLGWEVSAPKDGVYTVKQNLMPVDLQYRVSGKYAYVGLLGQDMLSPANLIEPQKIFTGKARSAISLTVRLDQVPADARGIFLESLKEGLGKVDDKAGENKAQKAFHAALAKEMQRIVDNVFKEGEEVNAEVDVDSKTKQLTVDLILRAKANSKLAENIAKMGQRQTLFGGVLDKNAAMNVLVNFDLPPELRDALAGVLEDMVKQVAGDLKDDTKQKQAVQLFQAIKPSLTSGQIDAAYSLRGPHPSKLFTLIAGFKLHDGDKLQALVGELIKDLPGNELKLIELNADKAGTVAIHKLALQGALNDDGKRMFGDHPIYVAFRNDAFFLALGEEGLETLKQAVTTSAQIQPAAQLDLSAARLGAANGKKTGPASDDARLRVTLEGGASLHVHFTMALSAIEIFAQHK
jgi:hypothetical protein